MSRRKALITGGSRGIGSSIADELEKRGFEVWTPTRQELDLSKPASVEAFVASHQPDVDVLVNNAGINRLSPLGEIAPSVWEEMQQVNLTAPLRLIQWASPFMRRQKWGRILNVSSIFSLVTRENRAPYSMTKAALNALTRSAAVEFGPDNVLANALCPGYVDTALTRQNNSPAEIAKIEATIPMGRLARAEELARVAGFLCSEENGYLTGQMIVVDGGFTCK